MDKRKSELRWGVELPLEFIEFSLFWEGHVNRSDLMEQFGVSVNQKSTEARISVPHALPYYALWRLGLDTDPGPRKPQDQQIVLLNREAVHEDPG